MLVPATDLRSRKKPNLLPVRYLASVMFGLNAITRFHAFCAEELACLTPHVMPFDAIVVNPAWYAVYGNLNIGDVGIEVIFRVPGTRCVGYDE